MPRQIYRPAGVYVCTLLIFLRFGLFQFINYFNLIREANGDVALPVVFVSLGLCVLTAAAAIWAFIGDNEGRMALMLLVALNIFWAFFLAWMALYDSSTENDRQAVSIIINLVFTSLLVVGFFWYFMSKEVVAYYKQND